MKPFLWLHVLLCLWLASASALHADPDTPDPIVGDWLWRGGSFIATFNPDGTISGSTGLDGTWEFLHNAEAQRKYRLVWARGKFLDKMVCAENMQSAYVVNQKGERFDVRRAVGEPPAAKVADPKDPLLGDWRWIQNIPFTFKGDGTVVNDKGVPQGTWEFLHPVDGKRQYRMNLQNGRYVDTFVLAPDGKSAHVVSKTGNAYDAHRALPTSPTASPANDAHAFGNAKPPG